MDVVPRQTVTLAHSFIGLLCDLDGTLVHSLPDICGNVNRVRRARALEPLPDETLRPFIGRGVENLMRDSLPELDAALVPELIAEFREYYMETPSWGGALYPGVQETLQRLKARGDVRLGIVTNKHSVVAERTLQHYLPGFAFDLIAGPDRVSRRKPEPHHILEVLERLSLNPARTWFIGDDPVDVACADAAGVGFFAAGYGFGGVGSRVEPSRRLSAFSEIYDKLPPAPENKV